MIERLLLDRIDAEARRAAVGGEHHRVAVALAHEAGAALALVQPAVARTQVALDAPVVEPVPPAAGMVAHALASLRRGTRSRSTWSRRSARTRISRAPEVGRQPGLALQRVEELARLGERLPHLRQERRAMPAVLEDHAVDARAAARASSVVLVGDGDRLGAPTAATPRPASRRTRRRRAAGSADRETPRRRALARTSARSGRSRSSEPMQPRSSPSLRQRDEGRARRVERGDAPASAPRARPSCRADRGARDRERARARARASVGMVSARRRRTTRSRRRATGRRRCRRSCAGRAAAASQAAPARARAAGR